MEKARACTQMVSSKTAQALEIARYRISFCHFPLMFHIAERLQYFDIFGVIMPPTSEKLRGHIGLGLSVHLSVRLSVCP